MPTYVSKNEILQLLKYTSQQPDVWIEWSEGRTLCPNLSCFKNYQIFSYCRSSLDWIERALCTSYNHNDGTVFQGRGMVSVHILFEPLLLPSTPVKQKCNNINIIYKNGHQ